MRKWSKKHKNYIQLQVTVKGLGGQGTQGSCSLHSFLTNLFLPHLNDSLKSEWPVRRQAYTHPLLPPHTLASSSVTRCGPNVRPIRTCEVRGHRRITVLTPTLSVEMSELRSVSFRPSWGSLATTTPFLRPFMNQRCSFSSHRSWLLSSRKVEMAPCSLSLPTPLPPR